ncbi:MAG TPA: DUF6750 family protein [Gammaproteobacteria bacterium]|nr:DUF6750 family protein [Gammaproteobacteria bacterium]
MDHKRHSLKGPLFKLAGYFGAILGLFFFNHFVLAGTLGDVADTIKESIGPLTALITAASYVAGVGFALTGLFKFKAHKDNPTQVPLSQPIVLLAIAAGLIFLPTIISTAGETIFGGTKKAGGVEGVTEFQ